MNELKIVVETGEVVTLGNMTVESLKETDNESLQELALMAKLLKARFKMVEDEVKERLEDGHKFSRIETTQRTKRTLPNDPKVREAFFRKYGLDAFDLKTVTAIEKTFGEAVKEDLDKVVIHETQNAVKYL